MLAVALSLAAAAAFALAAMQIHRVSGVVGALQLSRWQMGLAFAMTGAIAAASGGWASIDTTRFLWLAGSSAAGIMLASLTYVATIQIAGPRLSALLFTTAAPFAVALGWLFRDERVTAAQGGGVALIVLGIALAVTGPADEAPANRPPRPMWLGIALGLVTSLGQATGSLLSRPAMLDGADPVAAMAVRSGLGAAFFIALMAIPALRPAARPNARDTRLIAHAAFSGMVLGMSLMMAALARGDVGIVTTLTSTTPILILPMVWATTGRRPTALAWIGAALAVAGTALISIPV